MFTVVKPSCTPERHGIERHTERAPLWPEEMAELDETDPGVPCFGGHDQASPLTPPRRRRSRARCSRLSAEHAGGIACPPAGEEAPRRLEVRERGYEREAEEGLECDGEDGDD